MSFKDIDIASALSRLADRKIEQAIQEGKFDKIEGMGQPLDLEPLPADENARMQWWALKILRQNDVTPDEVQWRKQVDGLREELDRATTEARVRQLVGSVNELVKRVNTLGTNALSAPMAGTTVEGELAKLRGRQAVAAIAAETVAPSPPPPPEARAPVTSIRTCGNVRCRSRNPGRAYYCRRCGSRL